MRLVSFLASCWAVYSSFLLSEAGPSSGLEVFEELQSIPTPWVIDGEPSPSELVLYRIAIRQDETQARFQQHVIDISTPEHASYGQHMDYDDLTSFLSPARHVSSNIRSWLVAAGVSESNIQVDKDWINFVAPIDLAENMLNTRFYYFRHPATNTKRLRTLEYSLPPDLHEHIQMVHPTIHFGHPEPHVRSAAYSADDDADDEPIPKYGSAPQLNATYCNETVSMDCLRALYGVGDFRANRTSGAKLGISGFAQSHIDYHDLALFVDKWAPYAKGANFSVVSINGGNNTQNDTENSGTEASMDIELGLTLAYNTPVTFYTTGGRGPLIPDLQQPYANTSVQEPWLEHLQFLVKLPDKDLPNVLSISYGEDEQSLPASYTKTVCNLFSQLAGRGVSVITSSGDGGPGDGCITNDGKNTTRFMPQFPSSCPWVTSVGGTYGVQPEKAVVLSGGGFSDRFARPSWQDDAVKKYLSKIGGTFEGLYNVSGRGIPDVAAQGWVNHPTFYLGYEFMNGGTSASTPTFAAIIANLNSIRMSKGKRPLGFLNPWLYDKARSGLTDITSGGSRGCYNESLSGFPSPEVIGAGWNATVDWDPVTGLGTPLFQKLRTLMD